MSSSSPRGCPDVLNKSGRRMLEGAPRILVMTSRHKFSCLFKQYGHQRFNMLNTIKICKPFMTFITHPLHQNAEIYVFHGKTHTSSTVSNFFSFYKTTRNIARTLWTPRLLYLTLARGAVHSCPLAHLQCIGVFILMYSVERHSPPRFCAIIIAMSTKILALLTPSSFNNIFS